jgi:hypothetical protein
MADEQVSKLHEILSVLLDEIRSTNRAPSPGPLDGALRNNWRFLTDIEREYVARVLRHTKGNKRAAARILNVDRKTLDRMIKRHQLNLSEIQTAPYPGSTHGVTSSNSVYGNQVVGIVISADPFSYQATVMTARAIRYGLNNTTTSYCRSRRFSSTTMFICMYSRSR